MGDHEWCHVICAELISGAQFSNNSKIIAYLFAGLRSNGIKLPMTGTSQDQLISLSRIYQILPSPIVFLPPTPPMSSHPIICSICQQLITGRYVPCCYDKCDFRAHPVCLVQNANRKWNFIVDRRVALAASSHT